jgi:hypothetical protein
VASGVLGFLRGLREGASSEDIDKI